MANNPANSYETLLRQAEAEIKSADAELSEASELAKKAGLSIQSDLPGLVRQLKEGDYAIDRIAELRRNLLMRCRNEQPEFRGEDRWDKPRVPGERRRRIVREKDLPSAPPEPPPSGYVVYLGQMTTKIRHDRRQERHSQTKVVQEISKMWRMALTDTDRRYYDEFAEQVRQEYKTQHLEFRATGHFQPSENFERFDGAGLWMRKKEHEMNELEREIASYDTKVFPMRPPEFDEEYKQRELESKERRKRKLREEHLAAKKKAPPGGSK